MSWKLRVNLHNFEQEDHLTPIQIRLKRLKKDPEKYEVHKTNEVLRLRSRRKKIKEDTSEQGKITKDRQKDKNADYMRKYRDRKQKQKKKEPKTAAERQRECRKRKKEKNKIKKEAQRKVISGSASTPRGLSKRNLYRKAKVAKETLPQDPDAFASVVTTTILTSTPKKMSAVKKMICEKVVKRDESVHKELFPDKVKDSTTKIGHRGFFQSSKQAMAKVIKKYKYRNTVSSKMLGINRQTLWRYQNGRVGKKEKVAGIREEIHERVREYYQKNAYSRILPVKKSSKEEGKPIVLLEVSVIYLLTKFIEETSPSLNISYSTFAKLRPSNVRLKNCSKDFRTCECPSCTNIELALEAITKSLIIVNQRRSSNNTILNPTKSKYELVDKVLCPKTAGMLYHSKRCLDRECEYCKDYTDTIKEIFGPVEAAITKKFTWKKWVVAENVHKNKEGKDVVTRKMRLLEKSGHISDVTDDLASMFNKVAGDVTFPIHLFEAAWQYSQSTGLVKNIPPGAIMSIFDFAQNYVVKYSREVKSANFGKNQVTIHPIVVYYHQDGEIIRKEIIILSEDLTHDFDAVWEFAAIMENHLRNVRGVDYQREFRYSDGAAQEYKSKSSFKNSLMSKTEVILGFYGSDHGKNQSDGATGVTKQKLEGGVLSGAVINNAEEAFTYLKTNGEIHTGTSMRSYHFVGRHQITRDPRRYDGLNTIKGKLITTTSVPG